MLTGTTASLQSIVTDVGTMVTGAIGWVGNFATAIMSNPLLEAFVIIAFVGLGVGLIKRMIRL